MNAAVLEAMADAARLAPSLHNTQPWAFSVGGDNLEVSVDRGRWLPATDRSGRWMHLSCGAAVLNAAVAARAAGRICSVTVLPERSRPQLIGRLQLVGPHPVTAEDTDLASAITNRHTMREPFDPRPVPNRLVDRLRAAAEREGAWLRVVDRAADIHELTVLTERAEAEEQTEEAYRQELLAWLRGPGQAYTDGIPSAVLPQQGSAAGGSSVPIRSFHPVVPAIAAGAPRTDSGTAGNQLLLVLGTDADHHVDWVRAGMALQRLLLVGTVAGLSASPLTQALDRAGPREQLRQLLSVTRGQPQMILRLGYGRARSWTGRRSLQDLLAEHPDAPMAERLPRQHNSDDVRAALPGPSALLHERATSEDGLMESTPAEQTCAVH